MLFDLQENLIQPSVPELTLLYDGELGMSSPVTSQPYNSSMTSGYSTSQQLQSAGGCVGNGSIEAVGSNGSLPSVNSPQPLVQSSNVTQQAVRQPRTLKKLRQPVAGTSKGAENSVTPCCHRCTTCQTNMSNDAQNAAYVGVYALDKCGGNQSGPYNVPYTAHSSAAAHPPASSSGQLYVAPGNMENGVLSPGSCGDNLRMQSASPLVTAGRVPVQRQSCCSPVEHQTVAMQNVHLSMTQNGSQHVVEAIHSPSLTTSPYSPPSHNAQPMTSGPMQNGQFCQYSLPHGPCFVQATQRHCAPQSKDSTCGKTGCCSRNGQQTLRHPVMSIRLPSQASKQMSHDAVQAQRPHYVPYGHSSRLPLNVKHASQAMVMQCTESHQFSTSNHVAGYQGELPGESKGVHFNNHPGAQLLGPKSSTPVCQQGMQYDSDQYTSQDESSLINKSQQSKCQVDLQLLSSRSSTPVVKVPISTGPRTVNDLLSTIPIQNMIDWSMALPQDIATVDGFVESVLAHNSASTDSGLQVNDSAVSGETPPKTLPPPATDNCNNIACDVGDFVTNRDDGISQHPVHVKKYRNMDVEPDVRGHVGYVQGRQKITEKLSHHDDRPKLCSVAVNTSLYWPPDDNGHIENWHSSPRSDTLPLQNDAICLNSGDAGYTDNAAQAASDIAVQSNRDYTIQYSPSPVTISQRELVTDRDIELVNGSSPGVYDSMADVSLCTPPPPVFPNPSEESVVSDIIIDMPEYTTLSNEK